jgi:hypothetical protein
MHTAKETVRRLLDDLPDNRWQKVVTPSGLEPEITP